LLHQNLINKQDSRIIYFGITYNFGGQPKKSKEDSLRYDGSSSTGAPGFDAGASMSRTKAM